MAGSGFLGLDFPQESDLVMHSAATVFSQATSTDHLLTVPFDARTKNVSNSIHDWRSLTFDHKRRNSSSSFASLKWSGQNTELPAPVPQRWYQLIPRPYRFFNIDEEGDPIHPDTAFAGLIGDLPLLIALAAFSAVPNALETVLKNHIRNGRWSSHAYNTGRQVPLLLHHQVHS